MIERSNPLPPGVYWVDLFGAKAVEGWIQWATVHAGLVRVVRVSHQEGSDSIGWSDIPISPADALIKLAERAQGTAEVYDWVLFEVMAPVPRWPDDIGAGLPTVAERGAATTPEDTVQRPDPEPVLPALPGFGGSTLAAVTGWALLVGMVGVGIYAVSHD